MIDQSKVFRRRCFSFLCFLMLLAPAAWGQTEVTFRLIPEELWNGGQPDRTNALASGQVFLYRAGSYHPEIVARANTPQEITPGSWLWVAEAEGEGMSYVSVVSGKIHYPEGAEPYSKGLIGPVVPACAVDLGTATDWQGVTRLDAVSLDRPAVYPVMVQERHRFLVPAGRFLAYAMGPEGVLAISRVTQCAAGETVQLPRPTAPAAARQDLMVSVQMPAGVSDDREELTALLVPIDASLPAAPEPPIAALRTRHRTTFFFLDVNAEARLALQIRHPDAQSHRQEISPQRGGVRELADVVLAAPEASR